MSRQRKLRIAHWLLFAIFATWAILTFLGHGANFGDWRSPVTGLLAAVLAVIAAAVGFRGATAFRILIPALLITGALAVWIHAENLKRTDYIAGARGMVVDSAGVPISEATVTISFAKDVFQVIDSVRKAQTTTDPGGSFGFSYISCGDPHARFELSIQKAGYRPVSIWCEGFANRRIVLQRV